MLPLAKTVIATVAIFNFIATWNAFLIPLVFTLDNPDLRTLGVMAVLPIVIVFLFLSEVLHGGYRGRSPGLMGAPGSGQCRYDGVADPSRRGSPAQVASQRPPILTDSIDSPFDTVRLSTQAEVPEHECGGPDRPIGLARPFPAMSGAELCTGSNIDGPTSPRLNTGSVWESPGLLLRADCTEGDPGPTSDGRF